MKSLTSLALPVVALALAGLAALATPRAADSAAAAKEFNIDPVHSSLAFRIRYSGVSNFWGRFNTFSGTVAFDAEDLEKTTIDMTVKAESVDTANERRDGHLKSPDFFSAKEHPEIRFKSTSVKKTGDKTLEVTGDLTLRGTTKSVKANVSYGGSAPGRGDSTRIGFDATLTIKRAEFGITYGEGQLGGDVEVFMGLTAVGR